MEKELIFWLVLMVVLLVIELITVGLTRTSFPSASS